MQRGPYTKSCSRVVAAHIASKSLPTARTQGVPPVNLQRSSPRCAVRRVPVCSLALGVHGHGSRDFSPADPGGRAS
eukprot:2990453-Pyramimonas_sp.AAC.1